MDAKQVYGALSKMIEGVASGFDHAERTSDNTFTIFFVDGSSIDLTIPVPSNGGSSGNTDLSAYLKKEDAASTYVVKETGKSLVSNTDISQIGLNKTSIDTLKGSSSVVGSVANQISEAIGKSQKLEKEIVADVPSISTARDNVVYLVPSGKEGTYNQYMKIGTEMANLGSTDIDLSDYIKEAIADGKYVAKENGKSLVADTEIERLASVDNYDDTLLKARVKDVEDSLNIIRGTVEVKRGDGKYKSIGVNGNDYIITISPVKRALNGDDASGYQKYVPYIEITQDGSTFIRHYLLPNQTDIITGSLHYDWIAIKK